MSGIKMPFGKHKGEDIASVPADYLIWLNNNKEDLYGDIKDYIVENLDVLEEEAKELNEKRQAEKAKSSTGVPRRTRS